jgi:cold-inducible RNA-binding protein
MKKLFVGNIPHSTTEAELRTLFEPHGAIEQVSIVTDRDTGRSRGFAFVEMTDSAEAEKAIAALNGKELGGRALNINEARPKTDRGGPAPRGGRPGGGIRGTRVSLESRAGSQQHEPASQGFTGTDLASVRSARKRSAPKNVPWRCLCLVEAVPASPSVRKSARDRKSKEKKPSARFSENRKSRQVDPTN